MDELTQRQMEMVREERLRRSRQQFEYVRLNLINVGVLSLFAIFGASSGDVGGILAKISADKIVLSLMVVLALVSTTLFFLWMDDAISIAGFDHYLKEVEETHALEGGAYWFAHREKLNKTAVFSLKHWLFNTAVLLAFVCPPIILLLFILLAKGPDLPAIALFGLFTLIVFLLLGPFFIWRFFSRRLYG